MAWIFFGPYPTGVGHEPPLGSHGCVWTMGTQDLAVSHREKRDSCVSTAVKWVHADPISPKDSYPQSHLQQHAPFSLASSLCHHLPTLPLSSHPTN